ncbi:hypothetical protein Fmac_007710 [Flemingia macrophylla]|uniref:Uncharacterized protein n=1 Tax=Flemingia macrophylla TaxID=520843 RepID=A0ABD1MXN1_9FABA
MPFVCAKDGLLSKVLISIDLIFEEGGGPAVFSDKLVRELDTYLTTTDNVVGAKIRHQEIIRTMKGKRPKYVIKLPLQKAPVVESSIVQPNPSEAENIEPIPSQPSVVQPTPSQPPIVQPMPSEPPIVQPNQPISSQPIPSSMASQCAGARGISLSSPSQHNASPISMPSRCNQNVLEVDRHMSTETGEPSTYVDDDPPVGAVLQIIEPCNDGFYLSKVASKAITKTIKQQYVQSWLSWGAMSDEDKNVFFQRFKEEFQTIFSQARSEVASCGGGEEISPLDPVQEEKMRNKSWLVAAGGKNPKGRVYGVGKLHEDYLCRQTFTQQTSTSTAADSQKILRLEEEIRQSREEFRQSREENQRLQRKLESLVNVVLPLLPPAT